MQARIVTALTMGMLLSSCFKIPVSSGGTVSSEQASTQLVEAKAVSESKNVSTIDPNSAVEQRLAAPQTAALQGAAVTIPPGSLSIAAELVVEQAADFSETSITNEMGLSDDIQVSNTSAGMIIRPTENVDLKKPLSLAMPMPAALGMRLADTGSRYAVFYKYFDPTEAKLVTGMKVVDGVTVRMSFDANSGRDVVAFEGYFGAYWAAILSREVKKEEVPPPKAAEEPIINSAKVAVIESKGIVKETEIIVKQSIQIPETAWQKPVLVRSASGARAIKLTASANRKVSSCKVDLFENPKAGSGISLEAPLGPDVEVPIVKKTEHTLVGRFRCVDDQGRFTTSAWSESMVVPAEQVASGPTLCGDTAFPSMTIRGYDRGTLMDLQNVPRIMKCVYGSDVYVSEGGSFLLSIGDGSQVCDYANGSVGEGSFTMSCHKAYSNAVGGNLANIPAGNYRMQVDFSKSESSPTLTLSRLPCDKGDFYFVKGSGSMDNPTFPAPTAADKMLHLGGCFFVMEKHQETAFMMGGSMDNFKMMNSSGSVSCGNRLPNQMAGWDLEAGMGMSNVCGPENRYFRLKDYYTSKTHRFELRLGKAAQEWESSATSAIRYQVESSCPEMLYMYGSLTSAGQQAVRDVNSAYRRGVCNYEFVFAVDNPDLTQYKFFIGNETKSLLCGGNGSASSASCAAGVTEFDPQGYISAGRVAKVTVSGDGSQNTPTISSVYIMSPDTNCQGGLYLHSSVNAGIENSQAKAFTEISPCIFEKHWTPSAASPGFYVANGRGDNVCGADGDPTRVPVLNSGEASLQCRGGSDSLSALSQIKPLNAVNGTSYKVRVDMRFRNINGMAKVKVTSAGTSSCADNLHFFSTQLISGTTSNAQNKFTAGPDCTYSFTVTAAQLLNPATSVINFTLKADDDSVGYSRPASSYLSTSMDMNRGLKMEHVNGDPLDLNIYSNSIIRFYAKKIGTDVQITAQDLSYGANCDSAMGNWTLAGAGGLAISTPEARRFTRAWTNGMCVGEFVWNTTSATSFSIASDSNMPSSIGRCGLASTATVFSGPGTRDLVCNLAPDMSLREIGNFSAGDYLLGLVPPKSVEERFTLRVDPTLRMANNPVMTHVRGAASNNDIGLSSGPTASPSARQGAATVRDQNGDLWFFGGFGVDIANACCGMGYYNDLWRYTPSTNTWALMNGTQALNGIGNYAPGPGAQPSARSGAMAWFVAATNSIYLFGGYGVPPTGGTWGSMNDIWSYSITTGEWAQLKGPYDSNVPGSYQSLGITDPASLPQARALGITWTVGTQLWMFGGDTSANGMDHFFQNDLWYFDTAALKWAWMGGVNPGVDTPLYNTATQPAGRSEMASYYDSTANKVYVYGGNSSTSVAMGELWAFDVGSRTWTFHRKVQTGGGVSLIHGIFDALAAPGEMAAGIWKIAEDKLGFLDTNGNIFAYQPSTKRFARVGTDTMHFNQSYPVYSGGPGMNRIGSSYLASVWQGDAGSAFVFAGRGYDEGGMNNGVRNALWKITIP